MIFWSNSSGALSRIFVTVWAYSVEWLEKSQCGIWVHRKRNLLYAPPRNTRCQQHMGPWTGSPDSSGPGIFGCYVDTPVFDTHAESGNRDKCAIMFVLVIIVSFHGPRHQEDGLSFWKVPSACPLSLVFQHGLGGVLWRRPHQRCYSIGFDRPLCHKWRRWWGLLRWKPGGPLLQFLTLL